MNGTLEKVRAGIVRAIREAAGKARDRGQLGYEELPEFVLEVPREKEHGDFATNIAMLLAKQAKMAPRQVAEVLKPNIDTAGTWVAKMEIAGPGFINFYLDYKWLYDVLPEVEAGGDRYGSGTVGAGKKVQVEFVSAKPAKTMMMANTPQATA